MRPVQVSGVMEFRREAQLGNIRDESGAVHYVEMVRRITEWLGLERALKIIKFQPPCHGRASSTHSRGSEPSPASP